MFESRFVGQDVDGRNVPDASLVGAMVEMGDLSAGGYLLRIDSVLHDTETPGSVPLTLYGMSFRNKQTGAWEPFCDTGPDGHAMAIPMPGHWSRDGTYRPLSNGQFSMSCTSGAHVKCLRLGYAPWATGAKGESLAAYHQACTRMMRADYCGNGQPQTVPGRRIAIFDRLGRRSPTRFGRFGALWNENGAVCLKRSRVPAKYPMKDILATCPRLAALSDDCRMEQLENSSHALIGNRS